MATRSSMPPPIDHQTINFTKVVAQGAIRIDRDYSLGDGITRFSTEYPSQLEGRISIDEFRHTIETVNQLLADAERVSWKSVLDNIMECLTIYTWPILFSTHYQRCIRRLLNFIQSENENLYHPRGLSISNPVRCAFLFLEIKVYGDISPSQ